MIFRSFGIVVGLFLLTNATVISLYKKEKIQEDENFHMPIYVKWFNGWSYWLIAIGLIVALYNLLKTFKTFLNTKKLRKLTSVL